MVYEFEATVSNTADSGLIIAGNSASNISGDKTENSRGDYDIWVVKLNKNGKISWDKTLGGYGNDNVRSIQETKRYFLYWWLLFFRNQWREIRSVKRRA